MPLTFRFGTRSHVRTYFPTKFCNPVHDFLTHLLVNDLLRVLALYLEFRGKIHWLPKGHPDRSDPDPVRSRRKRFVRSFEESRHYRTARRRRYHTDPGFAGLKPPVRGAASLRINHHDATSLEPGDGFIKSLAVYPLPTDWNPSQVPKDGAHDTRKKIHAADERCLPRQGTPQNRNIEITGVVRCNQHAACSGDMILARNLQAE